MLYYLLLLLLFLSLPLQTHSSPLSTVAIARVSNVSLICAFLPSANQKFDLNCTSLPKRATRNYPSGRSSFSAIAGGDGFLCALGPSLAMQSNFSTMLWWEFEGNVTETKRVYKGPPIVDLSAGDYHVCGLQAGNVSNKVSCWRWPEMLVPSDINFSDVAVGKRFLCGLLPGSGRIQCFGNETSVVGKEPQVGNYTSISAGPHHMCAISVEGKFTCWGRGSPQLGDSKISVVSMALGAGRTCMLCTNGTVSCWGPPQTAPPQHLRTAQFLSIHAKGDAFCGVLMFNFSLVCWGKQEFSSNHLVFDRVLPGPCVPLSYCMCGVLPGSGGICPNGGCICQPCKFELLSDSWITLLHRKQYLAFLIIGAATFCVVVLIGQILLAKWCKNRYGGPSETASGRLLRAYMDSQAVEQRLNELIGKGIGYTVEQFSIGDLQSVTSGFSASCRIGTGSFGSVYRATLADGREVAIKRAESGNLASASAAPARRRDRETAFVSELAVLSRINHRNLVSLFGFCTDDCERVLIYEYMSNGTLHDNLHKRQPLPPPLATWGARLKLALEAARGIEYMHAYVVPPIIHRDIKSVNILLDKNWVAKIADFGLSLVDTSEEGEEDEADNDHLLTAGTVGYMDPEYYRLQRLTAKSDVYSFGVVLLELLTGCRVIQRYGESGTPKNVVDFAVPYIVAEDMNHVLDPKLPPPTPTETEAVLYVGCLAADCVSDIGQDRPTMTEVVCGLERAVAACAPHLLSRSTTFC